jgi:diguanylate cyclase (GGDEF)-like protein
MPQASQDWYQVMQALNNLQQQLSVPAVRQGGQQQAPYQAQSVAGGAFTPAPPSSHAGTPAEPAVETRHFTTEEVLSALSRIQLEAPGNRPGENFRQDLMHKLQSALADTVPSDESREVPSRENNILEIGGNLFDSVLSDKLVADTVKPWLNQLSVPLIKMALRDDSLFYDKSHLARQLINQIAELELFSAASKVENAVRKKIDGLLAEISNADEVTPDLLQKMLKEVGLLVHVQNKAYEGNIRDLVTSCEAEEQRAKPEKPANPTSALGKFLTGLQQLTGEEPPAKKDETLDEYRKRARRLKVGNWLMLGRDELQKRIRLAWIAKNLDKFVFVNLQGLREETLSQEELAQYLRSGEAVVLDDGDEQLVDRAQSSMLQKMHHQLLHETTHDQLTGLINRREFEKRLAETLARVRDSGMSSILCYLDLEQFSVVNNTFGYEGGDRALLETSRLIKQELGEDGILARIGGDEFAMVIENCSLDDALRMTSRLTGVFRTYRFTTEDKSLSLSFSAGVVLIDPESESIETLLQAAEASCRIARSKGTNYVQVYRPDETNLARHINTVKWVSRIDEALDKDSFELRCQPIVSIGASGVAVHHSEVLLRVPDGNGKLMSPVDLIMAAEHFRRMSSVDRWVVEHAFRWMAERRDKLDELGGLAINLSGASLNEEGLIDFVIGQAETHKIPMNKVCFEITETVGISHLSSASEFINELKKKTGCAFSLDDFGSGQSSYAYLKNLPVDYLKIDGAFVDKMDQNPYDFAVVKSITEIGHFMGKKIIAERVESEAVLKMLRQIGVDYAQGYYLGKPRNMKILGS